MKNILTVDIKDFRRQVLLLSIDSIKDLILGLHKYTKSNFHNYKGVDDPRHEMILDVERKRTILEGELQRRGYFTKEDRADFFKWLYNSHEKRVY